MRRNLLLIATGMAIAIAVLAALRATAWPFRDGETPTLAPLLERVTPAVVNIAVVGAAARRAQSVAGRAVISPLLRRS